MVAGMPANTTTDARPRRPKPPEGPWKSSSDSAAYLGISRRTIYRLMENGTLSWSLIGDRRRIAVAELERYARSRRRAS